MNQLYYGDCLTIMQSMNSQSVDLIYVDPPFNSNRAYNAIYKDKTGRPLPDQIEAFCDLWTLDEETERSIQHMPMLMREAGIEDATVEFWRLWLNALRGSNPRMLAYLTYMVERLVVMKRLLRPTASIYLHCDPTASHYIKVMMDGIFGHENYRNEIIWKRTSAHSDGTQGGRRCGGIHDTLLFYTKTGQWTWNHQYLPYDDSYTDSAYRHVEEGTDRRYRFGDLTGAKEGGDTSYEWRVKRPLGSDWQADLDDEWHDPIEGWEYKGIPPYNGRYWAYSRKRMRAYEEQGRIAYAGTGMPNYKRYLDEMPGVPLQDIWIDINPAFGKERLGYATQKPLALLERIIQCSTNEGDVVLDPFCGCATTIEAAQKLKRQWIGIDIAIHAIKRVAAIRLGERCHLTEGEDFEITGVPRTLEGAKDMWKRDKYHFQKWAIEEVDGFVTTKRTADGGIDGRLYFDMPSERDLQSMVVEVKGGANITIADLRALHNVLEREKALMAGLIIMEPLSDRKMANFRKLTAEAGDLEIEGSAHSYPKMQILSVPDILEGNRFDTPTPMGRAQSSQTRLAL